MNNGISKIKNKKIFEINDLFIYIFLLISIAILFVTFIILPKKNEAKGFKIETENGVIFSFEYFSEEYYISSEYEEKILFNPSDCNVTVYFNQEKTDYNIINYNPATRSVKMIFSTCSSTKDCIYEPEISSNGIIYCIPHELKIIPITSQFVPTPPSIGGTQ